MMWESSNTNTATPTTVKADNKLCMDVIECASLITNSFTLNSGGPRPVATSRRSSLAQRQRHPLASLSSNHLMAAHTEDEDSNQSPRPVQKRIFGDDFSMYDAENSNQSATGSPRTTCSRTMSDEEEDEDAMLPSADNSPVNFKVLLEKKPAQLKLQKSFEHDSNSMDSGYGNSSSSSSNSSSGGQFRFVQPTGIAPRRLDSGIASPLLTNSASKRTSFSVFNSCSSQGSLESMEEDYLDMFQLDQDQEHAKMPNISSLICGAIKNTNQQQTPERKAVMGPKMRVRRCLMMEESSPLCSSSSEEDKENSSPMVIKRVPKTTTTTPKRTNLMMLDANQQQQGKAFKRPEPLLFSPVQSKRYKSEVFGRNVTFSGARTADPRLEAFSFDRVAVEESSTATATTTTTTATSASVIPVMQRAVSMNETMIKNALSRSSSDSDLIGDFTKSFCLPYTAGRHNDLRSITVDTMAQLVRGDFDASVASFKVIDCRYPYEFEGGHIRNAKNLYTQEQVLEELVKPIAGEATLEGSSCEGKRNILVFHCEFSSERGPKLFRFLRSHDRLCNENAYPALHYPEIYLLDGGYKAFFETHPELCDPINYRMMLDPAYGQEYKSFRAKTKSWNGDNGRATTFKRVKSRSRVML